MSSYIVDSANFGKDQLFGNPFPSTSYDLFLSYAFEDRILIARPLAHLLRDRGLKVWYDEFELCVGDRITKKIDNGISSSKFVLVIISKNFVIKEWTQRELDGFITKSGYSPSCILPIWHEISKAEVIKFSPILAGIFALKTSENTLSEIVDLIANVLKR